MISGALNITSGSKAPLGVSFEDETE
ncbi:hypothetical protein CLSA_c31740 [Clostridium saccharobutylicum DSM 13864]|uniref:Uncharacterized protein n=1 Tax=Clostridium saccharobutylicum DSM 13864 TaxID=1345695 RepID=U5MU72_CLOSA|nr:hypothetical protein CLSA_c31740 [Clostridium saccharobutylicum DSM 13864]